MKTIRHGIRTGFRFLFVAVAVFAATCVLAQGTAFTYQGQLDDGGFAAEGYYDFTFEIYDHPTVGSSVSATIPLNFIPVEDGLFSVELDFGSGVFDGADRWMEIGVQTNAGGGYTILSPRTKITSTPYAIKAITAQSADSVPSSSVGSSEVINNSLTSSDLGPNSVGTSEVINNSLLAVDLAPDSVTASEIAVNAVGQSEIATSGVASLEVLDNSLTANDLAANSVTASEIAAGAVASSEVLNDSLTASDLAPNSVYASEIAANAVGASEIAANAVGSSEIATGAVGTSEVADGSLTGADLADNSVGSDQLADSISLGSDGVNGYLYLYSDTDGDHSINLSGGSTAGGRLWLFNNNGQNGVWMAGGSGNAGEIRLYNTNGADRVEIDGFGIGGGGSATFDAADGSVSVAIDGQGAGSGGEITLNDALAVEKVNLTTSGGGNVYLRDGGGITVEESDGTSGVSIQGGTGGYQYIYQNDGDFGIYLDGDSGGAGRLLVYDASGSSSIILDGDVGGDGRIYCDELQINGGSDLSEQFDIQTAAEPGSVVCIDAANPGKLVVSSKAYDRTVAGIVSGAGGVKPGMMMGQKGTVADGEHAVALSGRVYCRVDASQGAIQPGDLITTSDLPGHGMRVQDHNLAQGAIIGKAMTPLAEGQGLVLVLVSLQ